MEKDDDLLEIEVAEDKKPENEEVVVEKKQEAAAEPPKQQSSTEDALRQLKANLEAERNARMQAEKLAREHANVAQTSIKHVEDTNLTLVTNAVNTVKREAEILKANYRAALASSDYDAAAEAQEQMAMNAAKLLQLENGKAAMEAEAKQRQEVRSMPRNIDPVEAFASQLSPRSAEWVRKNPQFVTDQRLNQKMIAAHNLAMADGLTADTDDYFAFVENIVNQHEFKFQKVDVRDLTSDIKQGTIFSY